jgi:hypothetical protein
VQPDIESRKVCFSAYGPSMEYSHPTQLVNTAWLWATDFGWLSWNDWDCEAELLSWRFDAAYYATTPEVRS